MQGRNHRRPLPLGFRRRTMPCASGCSCPSPVPPSGWLPPSLGVPGVAAGVQGRLSPGIAALPQVFLCKVCLWCKQEQAHVPEEPLQRARVCSKRGLCTWRGSQVGESGTINCTRARGRNPLCSRSPGGSGLTPGPARTRAIPTSLGVLSPAAIFWDRGAWAPAGTAHRCAMVPNGSPWPWPPRQAAPSLGPVHGAQRASAAAGGRGEGAARRAGWPRRRHCGFLQSTAKGVPAARRAQLRGETPRGSLPAPSHSPGLAQTPLGRIIYLFAPRSRGSGDRGNATPPEMPQSCPERCGERRAQHSSPHRFPVCTGRCRLDRWFL